MQTLGVLRRWYCELATRCDVATQSFNTGIMCVYEYSYSRSDEGRNNAETSEQNVMVVQT